MRLTLSRPAEREIDWAIDELASGKLGQALRRLCHLRGRDVPELKEKKRRTTALKYEVRRQEARTAVGGGASSGDVAQACASSAPSVVAPPHERPIRPQPKPSRRIVARDVVADFRAHNDRCSVLGCPNGNADPHHIWPSGRGGPDETGNLIALCPGPMGHHEEIERIDAEAFAAKYASRLPPFVLLKIKLALMAEADKKLVDRGAAIDLDAEEG